MVKVDDTDMHAVCYMTYVYIQKVKATQELPMWY